MPHFCSLKTIASIVLIYCSLECVLALYFAPYSIGTIVLAMHKSVCYVVVIWWPLYSFCLFCHASYNRPLLCIAVAHCPKPLAIVSRPFFSCPFPSTDHICTIGTCFLVIPNCLFSAFGRQLDHHWHGDVDCVIGHLQSSFFLLLIFLFMVLNSYIQHWRT